MVSHISINQLDAAQLRKTTSSYEPFTDLSHFGLELISLEEYEEHCFVHVSALHTNIHSQPITTLNPSLLSWRLTAVVHSVQVLLTNLLFLWFWNNVSTRFHKPQSLNWLEDRLDAPALMCMHWPLRTCTKVWPWPLTFVLQNIITWCKRGYCDSLYWDMVFTRLDLDSLLWLRPLTSTILSGHQSGLVNIPRELYQNCSSRSWTGRWDISLKNIIALLGGESRNIWRHLAKKK